MGLFKDMTDILVGNNPAGVVTEDAIKQALSKVYDPDLNKDIVSLGFVQDIQILGTLVKVKVELTTPACPVKEKLKQECEEAILAIPGIQKAEVEMTARTRGRQIAQETKSSALGNVKNIIAVASGKGGVGKSTTAVNLAYALAAKGSRVGLLDADVYGPSVPLMTKAETPTGMHGQMVIPPVVDGIKIISIGMFASADKATILRGPMAASVIKQFLSQVFWDELDYLIIDYPPGTGDIQLTLSQIAPITGAVICTTPQEVALIDVRKAVTMFETLKVPVIGVVETMSYFICDGCTKKHYIFKHGGGHKYAEQLGVAFLGEIPIDQEVVQASDAGVPVVKSKPDLPAAKAYVDFSGAVAQQVSILHAQDVGILNDFTIVWKN
jgi:ATP-binding protein involved in chromosome partitioning